MDYSVIGKAVDLVLEMMADHLGRVAKEVVLTWHRGQPVSVASTKQEPAKSAMPTKKVGKKPAKKKATKKVAANPPVKPPTKRPTKKVEPVVDPVQDFAVAPMLGARRGGLLPPSPAPEPEAPQSTLSPHQSAMLSVLRDCSTGETFVSGEELAARTGVSTSSIGGLVKKLRNAGFRVEGRRGGKEPGYRLIESQPAG